VNSASNNLWEWLAPIDADSRFALCVVMVVMGLAALVLIVSIVARTVSMIQRARLEDALKRELLDRGMSANEIAQVVEASAGPRRWWLNPRGCGGKERNYAGAK
jgi:hypothetical protein